jgi:protein-disulfide isomerase
VSTSAWEAVLTLPVSPARDHIRGPVDAPLTLLEYGDYECPHCGAAHGVVQAIRARLPDGALRFVFRHFPLTTVHPHAQHAAEAAEAAGAQGRFWAMHDALFANQERLDGRDLAAYAEAIGLDLDRFGEEVVRHVHAAKVREDFVSGVRSGVNGTPTFYVNGVRHDGSWDVASLLGALQQAADAGPAG